MAHTTNIISSRGFLNCQYSRKHTEDNAEVHEILGLISSAKGVVFIKTGSRNRNTGAFDNQALDIFAAHAHQLTDPCVLVTSDGDRSVPSTYRPHVSANILNNPKITRWYTQNYDRSIVHPKLTYYPIGLDLHTPRWLPGGSVHAKLDLIARRRKDSPTYNRIRHKVLCDAHNTPSHPIRSQVHSQILGNPLFELSQGSKPFPEITLEYNKYNFVLSPRGNGMDTHRTWELFLAGVIVITFTSPLDEMFVSNNLPVVILHSLDDLSRLTQHDLDEWYDANVDKTKVENILPKLTYDYWLQR